MLSITGDTNSAKQYIKIYSVSQKSPLQFWESLFHHTNGSNDNNNNNNNNNKHPNNIHVP